MVNYVIASPLPYTDDNGWGPDDLSGAGIVFCVANNWAFELTTSYSATTYSMNINVDASTPNLPSNVWMPATIFTETAGIESDIEIVYIKSMSGTGPVRTISVVRGCEGTTPVYHGSGSKIECRMTAGVFTFMSHRTGMVIDLVTSGTKIVGVTGGLPVAASVGADDITLDLGGAFNPSGATPLLPMSSTLFIIYSLSGSGVLTWDSTAGATLRWLDGGPPTLTQGVTTLVSGVYVDNNWYLSHLGDYS